MAPYLKEEELLGSKIDFDGYWGRPTATIDWCEANYEVSFYVAEFWNTLSNLWIFVPPLIGILDAKRQRFETRYVISLLCLVVIGLGSILFHMTLLYKMQLMDEVPMVYGTAIIGYGLHQLREPQGRPNWPVVLFFLFYCLVFTVSYLVFKDPYIHETMFLLLVFSLVIMGLKLNLQQYSRRCMRMTLFGLLMYFFGGVVWNLDNHICPALTHLRTPGESGLPAPLRPITQLHAWWHFFSGYGTYILIIAHQAHRLTYLKREFSFHWLLFIPMVKAKGIATGSAKKQRQKVFDKSEMSKLLPIPENNNDKFQ